MSVLKRLAISLACGVLLTTVLANLGFRSGSEWTFKILLWQAVLFAGLMGALTGPGPLIGHDAQGNPMHEGTPIDLLFFLVGVLLGVPIYSALSYFVMSWWGRRRRNTLR